MQQRTGATLPLQQFFPVSAYVDIAARAEQLGYDSVWIPEVAGPDAFSLMTAIAGRTSTVLLASGVIPVQIRTPVVHAFSAATVDAFAPGRVILGLGTSSPIIVGQWHGLAYEQPLETLREATQIIRQVLAGTKTDIAGARYSSRGFRMPLFPQRIPIYFGALNDGMLRLAGELADGVLMNWVPAHAIPGKIKQVRAGAEKAGRDPDEVDIACYVRTCVADDPSPTREHLRRELTGYVPVPTYRKQFVQAGYEDEVMRALERWESGDRKAAVGELSDRMIDEINALGDAASCAARLEAFRAAGVTHLIVAPWSAGKDPAAEVTATLEAFAPAG
ncbi:MAG: LLM class flavin-dependent oxidoreductase [Actinomycetota bacterium]